MSLELALELLRLLHKARESLAKCLHTAVGLGLKAGEVLCHVTKPRAEVPPSAEA